MKAKVIGIEWDTDGEDVELPSDVTIEVENGLSDDEIVDRVTDLYGWCISCVFKVERAEAPAKPKKRRKLGPPKKRFRKVKPCYAA